MGEEEYVLTLTDPRARELAVAGGKGAGLARLSTMPLPVPGGFVVPAPLLVTLPRASYRPVSAVALMC